VGKESSFLPLRRRRELPNCTMPFRRDIRGRIAKIELYSLKRLRTLRTVISLEQYGSFSGGSLGRGGEDDNDLGETMEGTATPMWYCTSEADDRVTQVNVANS